MRPSRRHTQRDGSAHRIANERGTFNRQFIHQAQHYVSLRIQTIITHWLSARTVTFEVERNRAMACGYDLKDILPSEDCRTEAVNQDHSLTANTVFTISNPQIAQVSES